MEDEAASNDRKGREPPWRSMTLSFDLGCNSTLAFSGDFQLIARCSSLHTRVSRLIFVQLSSRNLEAGTQAAYHSPEDVFYGNLVRKSMRRWHDPGSRNDGIK